MGNDKVQVPFLPGESKQIGGLTVVYLPDWMLTRADCGGRVIGVLMPSDLAESFLVALRNAGIGFAKPKKARTLPPLPGDGEGKGET